MQSMPNKWILLNLFILIVLMNMIINMYFTKINLTKLKKKMNSK